MSYQDNRIFTLNEPNAPRLNPALACEIGLNESLLLLQLEFWIAISDNERDGRKWTYQSVRDIQEKAFPFWSTMTIQRAIKSLETKGYIITTTQYNTLKYDKTRWFTLNFEGLSNLKSISIRGYVTRSYQNDTGSNQSDTPLYQNDTTIPETISSETTSEKTTTNIKNVIKEEVPPQAEENVAVVSSLKDSQSINTDVKELMTEVPKEFQTKLIENRIRKGFKQGHSSQYLKESILFTADNSDGKTIRRWCNFLGKAIDGEWGAGYSRESDTDLKKQKALDAMRKQPLQNLKQLADAGNKLAETVLREKEQQAS